MIEPRFDQALNLCRYCQAQVIWATGPKGERIPFDADPAAVSEKGNWTLTVVNGDGVLANQPTAGQAAGMRASGVTLYSHHALHCPRADDWYTKKSNGTATRRARGGRR